MRPTCVRAGAATAVAAALAPAAAASPAAVASFAARSAPAGSVAVLRIAAGGPPLLHLQLLRAGAATAATRADPRVDGVAVTPVRDVVDRGGRALRLRVRLGNWPSGVYVARLVARDGTASYAPIVVRPRTLGRSPVLVVEPTNTWQAYNVFAGDSWYEHPAVRAVDLARPYAGDGLPPHFRAYDLGFLRWLARSGFAADVVADDDLARIASGRALRRLYRLVVFSGHEEYATAHVYDLLAQFRDAGGNLAFLSADNLFYRVEVSGDRMLGRTRWRDLGRPEAALVGAEYAGWNERVFGNEPYRVVDAAAAPWLFAGTGLHDGSRFGRYGIEIDERTAASPPGTRVLAEIPGAFGPGTEAQMTYYRRGRAQVFDAGVLNFGSTADWPVVSRIVDNLWRRLGGVEARRTASTRYRGVRSASAYIRPSPTR